MLLPQQAAALLQAVLDDPDDDAVRLVFADWCEEHGQADRAELIRLQIERAGRGAPQDDERWAKLPPREKALLERYASEWFAAPEGWEAGLHYEVRRGFPWVVVSVPENTGPVQDALRRWPITRLRPYLYGQPDRLRFLAEEALVPTRIRELDLYYQHVGPDGLRALAASPSLADLRWLNVGCGALGDEGATFLARNPVLPRLRHLDLRANGITPAGVRALIESEHRGAIESLVLCDNEVTVDDACAFLRPGRWESLTNLDLWNTRLGNAGVARLAACPDLARLTALGLNYNGITDDGLRALAASPHVRNLRTLSLSANDLTSACADVLIGSPHLQGLKYLRLTNNPRIHWQKRRKLVEHFGGGVTFEQM